LPRWLNPHANGKAFLMKILILGGTVFLGRFVAAAALERGDEVAILSRGLHGTAPEGVEQLVGDRNGDLAALSGRDWDLVIDTSGFTPEQVSLSARILAPNVQQYILVSSARAYPDWPSAAVDENSPVYEEGEGYGPMKAACERAAISEIGDRLTIVRPGMIVGPRDDMFRLPWWVERIARGGEVVAPGRPDRTMQFIDVRDISSWMLDVPPGVFNATGPLGQITAEDLFHEARRVTGSDATFTWVDDDTLIAAGVEPLAELPFWTPEEQYPGTWLVDTTRAQENGLHCRPMTETLTDIYEWINGGGREYLADYRGHMRANGIDPAREQELLARAAASPR
jgi:nucleoside-diphosphate-sugar epimerase